jgi:energy-coupling factor transport system permease protein
VNGAPLPLLALAAALCVCALAVSQPAVLLVLALGSALLVATAGSGPRRTILAGGLLAVATYTAINPFVAAQGNTVVIAGSHHLLLDLEVTLEEIVYGACAGLRLAAVAFACSAFFLRCDPDRLTALASRAAPRSALVVALAARLLPTLQRDGSALADAARSRGLALSAGNRSARVRAHGMLVAPLLATALERGLETAEAMTARGYGAARRTGWPAAAGERRDRRLYAPATVIGAAALWLVLAGQASFQYYDTLGDPWTPAALAAAALVLGACVLATLLEGRWSRRG